MGVFVSPTNNLKRTNKRNAFLKAKSRRQYLTLGEEKELTSAMSQLSGLGFLFGGGKVSTCCERRRKCSNSERLQKCAVTKQQTISGTRPTTGLMEKESGCRQLDNWDNR
ncbi:hypothetical protein TNCV_103181 [Trichonephila clavipes]|nr:hypothetical protein TNCV_103181 [Trichonephila clavipes]